MRLLEVGAADLGARDLGGDRQHRNAAAMAVEQAVDQVQVARPAAAGADRELAGQLRLGAGGERRHLLVAHMTIRPPPPASCVKPRPAEALEPPLHSMPPAPSWRPSRSVTCSPPRPSLVLPLGVHPDPTAPRPKTYYYRVPWNVALAHLPRLPVGGRPASPAVSPTGYP